MKPKSTGIAYLLLILTGIVGGHQYYIGNTTRGILYTVTVGFFLIGAFIDLFTLSSQVRKANDSRALRTMATRQQQPA